MRSDSVQTTTHRSDRGQIVVIFAVAALGLISMVGLVLDGGSTFAQRRVQQIGADTAALAGANAWLLESDPAAKDAAAIAASRAVASQNGYTHGTNQTVVAVTPAAYGAAGAEAVKVDISSPHQNAFAGIVGISTWDVSVTATAAVGPGGPPRGVAAFMFRADAFVPGTGAIKAPYDAPFAFGGNQNNSDAPLSPSDIAWTVFSSPATVNASDVKAIVNGSDQLSRPIVKNQYIGQKNQGSMTTVYSVIHDYLVGQTVTVPIVDAAGNFQGWAMFHVLDAQGGSQKTLTGYFTSGFSENLDICMTSSGCPISYGGVKVLKLIN